jgi:putative FmdB family regulatory protein
VVDAAAHSPILPEPEMPLFDFQCQACKTEFERLVRGDALPGCPACHSADVSRLPVARLAPAGKIEAIRLAHRRVADAQGHFNQYSPGERARLLKGKRV